MNVSHPTIVFTGGGTAGHLMPGLAVAEVLRGQSGVRIVFAGSGQEWERRLVEGCGFEYRSAGGVPFGRSPARLVRFLWGNARAYAAGRRLVRELLPAVVVGLGGYASAAVARAAVRHKVPLVLLEQNTIAGRTTYWLARRAHAVCTAFDETRDHLPRGTAVWLTGNPVRGEIAESRGRRVEPRRGRRPRRKVGLLAAALPPLGTRVESGGRPSTLDPRPSARPTLLVLGGSQGARGVNDAVISALGRLRSWSDRWRIVHQAGRAHEQDVRKAYRELPFEAEVAGFFHDMPRRYAEADLVVCRAGGTTLAEIVCAGLPAVLMPFPHAARDHQRRNAEALARTGAAQVVLESPTDRVGTLAEVLEQLWKDEARRRTLAEGARRLARPHAAEEVAQIIESIAGGMTASLHPEQLAGTRDEGRGRRDRRGACPRLSTLDPGPSALPAP